jgi:hypothetical protein
LQVFHMYVAYAFHTYSVFQLFFLQVFHTHVSSVLAVVCMLQVFNLDVSKVDLVLQLVFQMHVLCVLSAFRRML